MGTAKTEEKEDLPHPTGSSEEAGGRIDPLPRDMLISLSRCQFCSHLLSSSYGVAVLDKVRRGVGSDGT